MTSVHAVKQMPPWATEKAAPHFGKPSGLAPCLLEAVENMHLIPETRHWARFKGSRMKKRILIAEDDAGLRMLYGDELEEEGYEVFSARDGEEGIRRYELERPDLVVLDIVMPVMDGIETLKRIRKIDGNRVPIILHTSHPKYLECPDIHQANALILKSADLEELKEAIADLLKTAVAVHEGGKHDKDSLRGR